MNAHNELLRIMERISDSTATDAEIAQFNSWCDAFKDEQIKIDHLEEIKERVLLKIHSRIIKKPYVIPLFIKRVAAAAVATIVFSIWFYSSHRTPPNVNTPYANDVAAGKLGATLTLANGKKINLTVAASGNLANEPGVVISKNSKGEIIYTAAVSSNTKADAVNKLETSNGQQTQVQLPDGSIVYLNASSSLSYPVSFANKAERKVSLDGEGYFEIAKDKAHPFIVESKGQEVRVLGTHFDISAYRDEPVSKTTLLEGSIIVSTAEKQSTLTPGSQLTNDGRKIDIRQVDTEISVAWKNNLFLFEDEELGQIMGQVERWYDVEVTFSDNIAHERFGGGVSRFSNVSKLLKSLEATGKVHFRIAGRKIYVSK